MKNKISFIVILCTFFVISPSLKAQMEVQQSGNVRINKSLSIKTEPNTNSLLTIGTISNIESLSYGIYSHMKTNYSMPTGPVVSIFGFADAQYSTSNFPINHLVGVYGRAYMTSSNAGKFSAGIVGVASPYNGIGVYGALSSNSYSYSLPTTSYGSFAGYFAGSAKVTGTLYATLNSTSSDSRLKEDIRDLNSSATNNLTLLHPVEYKLKSDSVQCVYMEDANELKVNHFGLVAQEVQQVFPNLVYEGSDGYLSINYTELIPVLIKEVQELSVEVEELKKQISESKTHKQ